MHARQELDMTQKQLAMVLTYEYNNFKKVNETFHTINDYEAGRAIPNS